VFNHRLSHGKECEIVSNISKKFESSRVYHLQERAMTVKLKIYINKPKNAPFGYREQTFFVKLPDSVYNGLLDMANEQDKDFQTLFSEIMKSAADGSINLNQQGT